MVYGLLADLVMLIHFAGIGFIVAGGLLVWRWPRLVWLHVPGLVWGVTIISVGFTCPLTPLEKYLRRLAGEPVYRGGFIDHYLEGVVYPAELTWLVWSLVAVTVVAGYGGLLVGRRRRRAAATTTPARHDT
jgi:hypothetical protein